MTEHFGFMFLSNGLSVFKAWGKSVGTRLSKADKINRLVFVKGK
jgi:hypothetical protein